jgi:hypothetical protein
MEVLKEQDMLQMDHYMVQLKDLLQMTLQVVFSELVVSDIQLITKLKKELLIQ